MDYKQIIWLASYPKSGNTWLRCFLDAYFLGDLDINELLCSAQDDRCDKQQIGDGSDIAKLPIQVQHLTRPMGLLRVVRHYNESDNPIPLFLKTHTANLVTNGIELLTECLTKSIIHIVRDPRDVLPSFANHMGVDLDQALEYMRDKYRNLTGQERGAVADFISSWGYHTESFITTETHNIRTFLYEDMRENPERVFTEMLMHAGVVPNPKRVSEAVEITKLENLRKREKADGFREGSPKAKNPFFHKGQVGGWRDTIEPRHRTAIEKAFGRTMKRLGYINKRRVA